MGRGLIIIGYQGIGKSSCGGWNDCIDLESSCFRVNGERADNWYLPYCQTAMHLANQGYTVFTSSHAQVRETLKTMPLMENVGKVVVFCPTLDMRDEWIQRLEKRYNYTLLDKDYRALMNAKERYAENIIDLIECGLPVYQPAYIEYNLMRYVMEARHDWCEGGAEYEAD